MAFGEKWTPLENGVVVAAYLDMLELELRGEHFVKTRVNDGVRRQIDRTHKSVESKFQNVSAVLIELSHPYVRGYRPFPNFQGVLRDAVLEQIQSRPSLRATALAEFVREPETRVDFSWRFTEAPKIEFSPHRDLIRRAVRVDFVQVDAANRALGFAGELAVVELERHRLAVSGLGHLARSVSHVSVEQGDGAGYDIRSFDSEGEEKFIEVKTTRRGPQWPMLISSNEVRFSQEETARFHLYRVFDFDQPERGLYELPGSIEESCRLRPTEYEARPA